MTLLGLPLAEAEQKLREAGTKWNVVWYRSRKPYENADAARVVRAVAREDGAYELVVCEFVTNIQDAPKAE